MDVLVCHIWPAGSAVIVAKACRSHDEGREVDPSWTGSETPVGGGG